MKLCLSLFVLLVVSATTLAEEASKADVLAVKKMWDQAPHNAFTDLIRFRDNFYCVFREGAGHVSPNGSLRILRSNDGSNWESIALVSSDEADLRDAKISVTPDGKLCLAGAGALHQLADAKHQSYIWYSSDGATWSEPIEIGDPNFWIWRIVWHKNSAYGFGYSTATNDEVRLYQSDDGKAFRQIGSELAVKGYANETGLIFLEDDSAMCVLRRDRQPNSAMLGRALPPYTDWKWQDLGEYVGGPELMKTKDGRYLVAGRSRTSSGAKTMIWELDPDKAKLHPLTVLPSGGDTSYPGLVEHDGKLWVSYYSSHEGKTNIYLAEVRLPQKSVLSKSR